MSAVMKLTRSSSCPSKVVTTLVTKKRCGNCGAFGHNRRTCAVPAAYAAICHPVSAPKPAHKSTQKKCGHCGMLGHNRRTCPTLVGKPEVVAKTYTTTQLFARLPNYIPHMEKTTPEPLEGLKGCKGLFRETKKNPSLSWGEMRVAQELALLL